MLLLCACSLVDGVPLAAFAAFRRAESKKRKRRLTPHSRVYLSRLLLACVGIGFLWRSLYTFAACRTRSLGRTGCLEEEHAAVGALAVLGLLAIFLATVSALAARRLEASATAAALSAR